METDRRAVGENGFLVLYGFAGLGGTGFGREVRDWVEDAFGVDLAVASLYKAINRLTELGLIRLDREEPHESGPPRRVYAITGLGRRVALQEARHQRDVLTVLEDSLGIEWPSPAPEII